MAAICLCGSAHGAVEGAGFMGVVAFYAAVGVADLVWVATSVHTFGFADLVAEGLVVVATAAALDIANFG